VVGVSVGKGVAVGRRLAVGGGVGSTVAGEMQPTAAKSKASKASRNKKEL
jgi:hypothetical protein